MKTPVTKDNQAYLFTNRALLAK